MILSLALPTLSANWMVGGLWKLTWGTIQHAQYHFTDLFSPQIDALPEIVEAVEGKVEVFLDGGVRKGTDVLKALALGAKAVFVGRPIIWGLASQVIGEQSNKYIKQSDSTVK